ncbi:MAG TPA: NlpC/P60 family protein [Mesorhizobium sp.]
MTWVETPYLHQACRKGVGCDCLGLVRGIWRALYGFDLEAPGPYAPDWAEAGGGEDLLAGMRRNFHELAPSNAKAGHVFVFRWRPNLPAKHAGILVEGHRFVHAYQGAGAVMVSALVPQWRRRVAAAFSFPEFKDIST